MDRQLLSGDVDLFSDEEEDLSSLIVAAKLDKTRGGFYLEPGFELSFRTNLRWRQRAATVQRGIRRKFEASPSRGDFRRSSGPFLRTTARQTRPKVTGDFSLAPPDPGNPFNPDRSERGGR